MSFFSNALPRQSPLCRMPDIADRRILNYSEVHPAYQPKVGKDITTMTQENSMRAVVFKGVGHVQVEDRKIPTIQDPRDAIIRVTVTALCGSDLHWYRGHQKIPAGFIPGHEFAGVIHELGSQVAGFKIGDAVVVSNGINSTNLRLLTSE